MSTIKCMRNDDENFGPLDIKIAKATRVWKLWYLRHHRMNREREESQVSIDFPRLCDSNQYTSDSYLYEYITMLKHAHTHTHTHVLDLTPLEEVEARADSQAKNIFFSQVLGRYLRINVYTCTDIYTVSHEWVCM